MLMLQSPSRMTDVPQGSYAQVAQQNQIHGLAHVAFAQPQQQQQAIQQQQVVAQHQMTHTVTGTPLTESQMQLQTFWPKQMQGIAMLQPTDLRFQELPLARIKKIMKQDEEVKMISAEAPVLFSKAAEMFVAELSLRSWIHTEDNKRRTLQRNDVAMAISKFDQFDFLIDIVPREELKPAKRFPTTMVDPSQMQYYLQLQQSVLLQQQQQQQQQQQSQQQQAGQTLQHPPHAQAQQLLVQAPIQFQVQPQLQLQQQQQQQPAQLPQLQSLGGAQSLIIQAPQQMQAQQQPHTSGTGVIALPPSLPSVSGMWNPPHQQGVTVANIQAHPSTPVAQQQIILQQSQQGEQTQTVADMGMQQTIQYVLPQPDSSAPGIHGHTATYLPLYSSANNPGVSVVGTPTGPGGVDMVATPVEEPVQDTVTMGPVHSS